MLRNQTLSPRELALVIGVSESSMKRWIDAGAIEVMRTAGGHRRIPMRAAIQFIRRQRMKVLRPDLLGIPDMVDVPLRLMDNEVSGPLLVRLTQAGKSHQARALVVSTYLAGESPAWLCDGPIRDTLIELGKMWQHDERGIYYEHRATDVFIQALNQIRQLARVAGDDAPVAVGGTPTNDPYILSSLMAAAVVAEAGFREDNLGPDTPIAAFLHAVDHLDAKLVWLSVTSDFAAIDTEAYVTELATELGKRDVPLVVGGRVSADLDLPASAKLIRLNSMFDLATYADDLAQELTQGAKATPTIDA